MPEDHEEVTIQYATVENTNQKELKEQVAKTIQKLNEKESAVLTLFYIEEMSIKETASILGYSESNVKVLLHRARKNFKHEFEKL